jgi:SAM-dependent methyltransferase
MGVKYITVTEIPGAKASKEQLERLYQRYHFAYQFCRDKDVLEVGCGAGQGLGYLAKTAKKVVGGDIDENNLSFARNQYKDKDGIQLDILDAQTIPFLNESFDVVILYEAIYYLRNPEEFISEAHRILRDGGLLIIGTVNKDRPLFNPSPFSVRYFSVPELCTLFKQKFSDVDFYGGFPIDAKGMKDIIVSFIKKVAITLHLIPKTMKGKELLKRLFFGKLYTISSEIKEDMTAYLKPIAISSDLPNSSYKVIFVVGHKRK